MLIMADDNNGRGYESKPPSSEVWRIRKQMKLIRCNPAGFCEAVAKGAVWMGGVMRGGMTRDCWNSQQIIGLDFDNKVVVLGEDGKPAKGADGKTLKRFLKPDEPGYMGPGDAVRKLRAKGIYPAALYFTYSSTPEHPCFRVVLMLDEACEDPDVVEDAIGRLLHLFPEADQSCKDLARLFFGTNGTQNVYSFTDAYWTPSSIGELLVLPQPPAPAPPQKRRRRAAGGSRRGGAKVDFDELKAKVDLYGMICADVCETGRSIGQRIQFHRCPICGHRDCFCYYPVTGTWTCFSDSNTTGIRGGTAIDYVMAREGLDAKGAADLLAEDLGLR